MGRQPLIRPLSRADLPALLELALAEGWACELAEYETYLTHNPEGNLACEEAGVFIGGATSWRNGHSAWIGNFILAPRWRGHGSGAHLLRELLARLEAQGVTTFLLDAAPKALPLYRRHGFVELAQVVRWRKELRPGPSNGRADPASTPPAWSAGEAPEEVVERCIALDAACWGDERSALLHLLLSRRGLAALEGGFISWGAVSEHFSLGPWEVEESDRDTARALLERALGSLAAPLKRPSYVLLDALAPNESAGALLKEAGFREVSSTTLMARGPTPSLRSESLYALATLGAKG